MTNRAADEKVSTVAREMIAAGREIGLQAVAYLDGECVVDIAEGVANKDTGEPVTPQTLFNVFSVSKAIAAVCVHILVDRGAVGYETKVAELWPEFGVRGKSATTVRDVLTHRSGVPQMPEGVQPEDLLDWDGIAARIADLEPIAAPGTKALYQPLTHGWIIGEIVRRADSQRRDFARFVREEIAEPLKAPDLWFGLPETEASRVANLDYALADKEQPPLAAVAMPPQLALAPWVFERPDVRRSIVPAVGGIFNARSCARFWAMLAQGGELDGYRLLSRSLVETFNISRGAEPDLVMYGRVMPLSIAGFWLGMPEGSTAAARDERVICHPGAGNTIAWADLATGLAVSICHNRMYKPETPAEDGVLAIANAIREAVGVR